MIPSVIIQGPAPRGAKQALEFVIGPHRGTVPVISEIRDLLKKK